MAKSTTGNTDLTFYAYGAEKGKLSVTVVNPDPLFGTGDERLDKAAEQKLWYNNTTEAEVLARWLSGRLTPITIGHFLRFMNRLHPISPHSYVLDYRPSKPHRLSALD